MILEFIFNLLFAIANFLVGLFPAFPSFDSLNISLDPLLYVLRLVNMCERYVIAINHEENVTKAVTDV